MRGPPCARFQRVITFHGEIANPCSVRCRAAHRVSPFPSPLTFQRMAPRNHRALAAASGVRRARPLRIPM